MPVSIPKAAPPKAHWKPGIPLWSARPIPACHPPTRPPYSISPFETPSKTPPFPLRRTVPHRPPCKGLPEAGAPAWRILRIRRPHRPKPARQFHRTSANFADKKNACPRKKNVRPAQSPNRAHRASISDCAGSACPALQNWKFHIAQIHAVPIPFRPKDTAMLFLLRPAGKASTHSGNMGFPLQFSVNRPKHATRQTQRTMQSTGKCSLLSAPE